MEIAHVVEVHLQLINNLIAIHVQPPSIIPLLLLLKQSVLSEIASWLSIQHPGLVFSIIGGRLPKGAGEDWTMSSKVAASLGHLHEKTIRNVIIFASTTQSRVVFLFNTMSLQNIELNLGNGDLDSKLKGTRCTPNIIVHKRNLNYINIVEHSLITHINTTLSHRLWRMNPILYSSHETSRSQYY